MDKNCDIVRDLLPLYAEDMLRAASKELVEEHLQECPACKAEMERLTCAAENVLPQSRGAAEEALPIKQVKKKLNKRRRITVCVTVLLTVAVIFAYFAARPVSVDYGESEWHSEEEIDAAAAVVRLHFVKMSGCKLYSLRYAGDERCEAELNEIHRNGDTGYTDCIVLNSVFRSPLMARGGWEPNELYSWSWTLAKNSVGMWIIVNYGYA